MTEEMQEEKINEKQFDFFLLSALCIAIIVIFGLLLFYSALQQKPETFSQVYLDQKTAISSISPNAEFPVSFFIENFEGKTAEYSYRIIAENQIKKQGTISLQDKEKKEITENISFSLSHPDKQKVLIEIRKAGKTEPYTLWFWVMAE